MQLLKYGPCIYKRGHEGDVHCSGGFACETGDRHKYVDQETADMYPPCGFAGILTKDEIETALEYV